MILIEVKTPCDSQQQHYLLICIEALCTAESQGIHRQSNNNIERVVATVMVSIKKFDKRWRAHPTCYILIPMSKSWGYD